MTLFQKVKHVHHETKQTAHHIVKSVHKVGIVRGSSKLYTVEGLEQGVVPVMIPIFELLKIAFKSPVERWINVLKGQRDLYRVTLIFPTLLQNLRHPSIIHSLAALGSLCETAQFLHKYEVLSFDFYRRWAVRMELKPLFTVPLFRYFLLSPKELFWFLKHSCVAVKVGYHYYHKTKAPQAEKLSLIKEKQLREIKKNEVLTIAFAVGSIALIILKSCIKQGMTRWGGNYVVAFHVIDLLTQGANFIRFLIAKPQRK